MLVGVPANRNLILNTVSEAPYRVTAEMIRSTCGQTVSHGGVWNLIQQLGGRISEEEKVTISENFPIYCDGDNDRPDDKAYVDSYFFNQTAFRRQN